MGAEVISLRPYQKSVAREVALAYQAKQLGVLLQMATGAGKTRTAAYIVERFTETGRQCLWTVHRDELLMQAAMTFAEFGIKHRLICSASSERAIKAQQFREHGRTFVDPSGMVAIGSIMTIVRRLDVLTWLDPDIIIPDEAHLSLNTTNRKIIGHLVAKRDVRRATDPSLGPTKLLGLTATPKRLDRQSFARKDGGLYDVMVKGPSVKQLMEWGNLAKWEAFGPPVHFALGADLGKRKGGDYDTDELEKELDAPQVYGDVVEHYRKLSHGKPAIGFCPTVKTAEKFAQAFRDAGYRAIALDGQTDDTVRRQSLQQLGRGELDVVMSVSILIEGTDVPYATTALLLRKTESVSLLLQAIGRVLRPHPDKEKAIILDFVGVLLRHGPPDMDREWTLEAEKASKAEAANDNEPGAVDQLVCCPKCFQYHLPAPACPNEDFEGTGKPCGYVYPVKQRREVEEGDGELRKLTQADFEEAQRRLKRAMQGQAQTEEDLVHVVGMSRARAKKVIQAREKKAQAIGAIMDGLARVKAETGQGTYATLGVTLGDIRRAKPKELAALLEKVNSVAGNDGFKVRPVA